MVWGGGELGGGASNPAPALITGGAVKWVTFHPLHPGEIFFPCWAGWEGSCLTISQSPCVAKVIAHASCHTSDRVGPWMLSRSNCIKLYLTSSWVLHPNLPITCVDTCRLVPWARPRLCGKSAGWQPRASVLPARGLGECNGLGGRVWRQSSSNSKAMTAVLVFIQSGLLERIPYRIDETGSC